MLCKALDCRHWTQTSQRRLSRSLSDPVAVPAVADINLLLHFALTLDRSRLHHFSTPPVIAV